METKTILITGASGFLGTWIGSWAKEEGYLLIGIDLRGPLKPEIWDEFATASCETVDFETLLHERTLCAVLHLAGGASVGASEKDPYADFSSLLPGTSRLALFVARFQKQAHFFLFSSAAVYGNPATLPIQETASIAPISPYGVHKELAESMLRHYSNLYGIRITICRIFSVYGPGLRKQLVWDVAQKAQIASNKGKAVITLFGTGNETRDFIYVKDICRALSALMNSVDPELYTVFNLAAGEEISVATLAHTLVECLGLNVSIQFNGEEHKGNPKNWLADISKLRSLGFVPQFKLAEGLKEVSAWITALPQ